MRRNTNTYYKQAKDSLSAAREVLDGPKIG